MYCTLIRNENFNIDSILNSGQNFPFSKDSSDFFHIFINNKEVLIKSEVLASIFTVDKTFFDNHIVDLFDLKVDYGKIRYDIAQNNPELMDILLYGGGIRFINQPLLQVITTFIISQNNNIKRINSSIKKLIDKYGTDNSFPSLETLKTISKSNFRNLGVGFRDKYLFSFFQNIDDEKLENLKKMNTDEARNFLMGFNGIGRKVANCILLFGLRKRDVFPVDTHIKKIMEKLYFDGKNINSKKIEEFAVNKFGELAGYVQQYLFFYDLNHPQTT